MTYVSDSLPVADIYQVLVEHDAGGWYVGFRIDEARWGFIIDTHDRYDVKEQAQDAAMALRTQVRAVRRLMGRNVESLCI